MPNDEASIPVVVTFTIKAPINTDGHRLIPNNSSATSAMPVGGQTAVALAFRKACVRPNFPARM
jgi:hypothetical protein